MRNLIIKHPDLTIITLLSLFSLVKLLNLPKGFVLGEPDTSMYIELAGNFHNKLYPIWHSQGWYFGLPLYPFLAFLVSFLVPNINSALIIVSIISSVILTAAIYWFVSQKISRLAATFCALSFMLAPEAIFYSRIGLIEMTVSTFSFIFLFLFDIGISKKDFGKVLLSGVFLGLGILSKYTALSFVPVPLIHLVFKSLKAKLANLSVVLRFDLLSAFIAWGVGAALSLPLALYFLTVDRARFVMLSKATLLESPEFWGRGGFNFYLKEYVSALPLLLGWPGIILTILGLIYLFRRKLSGWELFVAAMLVATFLVIKRNPSPRYFVFLVPFFAILSGLGVLLIVESIQKRFNQKKLITVIITLIFVLIALPGSYRAYKSTNHYIVEDVANFIKERNQDHRWVFTTYWPNLFSMSGTGEKTTWLTNSSWDVKAFGTDHPEGKNSLQILESVGGFAVIEDLYSEYLWSEMDKADKVNSLIRREPKEHIEKNYEPVRIFTDSSPNFPYFEKSANEVRVYEFKKI